MRNLKKFSRFVVSSKKDIIVLISIFNGNLFLTKRKIQLNKWLEITNIPKISNNFIPFLQDGWLSGFVFIFYYNIL